MAKKISAIFLDRDGTINIDRGYLFKICDFQFIDGVIESMYKLKKMGFALVLITNQSGIARGIFSKEHFLQLTEWLRRVLSIYHADFDGIYFCPHHPQAIIKPLKKMCTCRKPQPGMFLLAQKELHINMSSSYMVGDKIEDMQSANAAGVGTKVLVQSGNYLSIEKKAIADWVISSLKDLPTMISKSNKFKKIINTI